MCLICDRIQMIKMKPILSCSRKLENRYVVLGDTQRIKGYTLVRKSMKQNFLTWMKILRQSIWKKWFLSPKPSKMPFRPTDKLRVSARRRPSSLASFSETWAILEIMAITAKARCGRSDGGVLRWWELSVENCLIWRTSVWKQSLSASSIFPERFWKHRDWRSETWTNGSWWFSWYRQLTAWGRWRAGFRIRTRMKRNGFLTFSLAEDLFHGKES